MYNVKHVEIADPVDGSIKDIEIQTEGTGTNCVESKIPVSLYPYQGIAFICE